MQWEQIGGAFRRSAVIEFWEWGRLSCPSATLFPDTPSPAVRLHRGTDIPSHLLHLFFLLFPLSYIDFRNQLAYSLGSPNWKKLCLTHLWFLYIELLNIRLLHRMVNTSINLSVDYFCLLMTESSLNHINYSS